MRKYNMYRYHNVYEVTKNTKQIRVTRNNYITYTTVEITDSVSNCKGYTTDIYCHMALEVLMV